jgi:hypothetical protein
MCPMISHSCCSKAQCRVQKSVQCSHHTSVTQTARKSPPSTPNKTRQKSHLKRGKELPIASREAIGKRGKTSQHLATLANVSPRTVERVERVKQRTPDGLPGARRETWQEKKEGYRSRPQPSSGDFAARLAHTRGRGAAPPPTKIFRWGGLRMRR